MAILYKEVDGLLLPNLEVRRHELLNSSESSIDCGRPFLREVAALRDVTLRVLENRCRDLHQTSELFVAKSVRTRRDAHDTPAGSHRPRRRVDRLARLVHVEAEVAGGHNCNVRELWDLRDVHAVEGVPKPAVEAHDLPALEGNDTVAGIDHA